MDALERMVLKALADGSQKTGPQIRKLLETEYNTYMTSRKGHIIELQDQNIYYTADKLGEHVIKKCPYCSNKIDNGAVDGAIKGLLRAGFIILDKPEDKKLYSLRECCIDGVMVFRASDNKTKLWMCPDMMTCKIPEADGGVRQITEDCKLYSDYERIRVPFRMMF